MRKNYFTLNELCVVTSIAAILVSLAFSAYSGQLKMSKKKVNSASYTLPAAAVAVIEFEL